MLRYATWRDIGGVVWQAVDKWAIVIGTITIWGVIALLVDRALGR